jgi:4'-phosphopantetheinyl transferase
LRLDEPSCSAAGGGGFGRQEMKGFLMMISLCAVSQCHNLSGEVYKAFLDVISLERQQKAARFLRKEDACRCITGEVLTRYCIAKIQKSSFRSISFKKNEYGKPSIDFAPNTHFSISHSGTWTLCAIDTQPLGVDVERLHVVDENLAKRFFSQEEYMELTKVPIEIRQQRFFDYWTLKESYIKAIGKGLSCPLDSFTIYFSRDNILMKTRNNLPTLFFKQYDLDPDYKCALCASNENFPEKIKIYTPEELLIRICDQDDHVFKEGRSNK